MQPELEILNLENNQKSINFFNIEKPRFEPFWHFHPETEITLIVEGQGIRYVGDSIQPFQSGDLVMVGPDLPHHWVSDKTEGHTHKAIVLQFNHEIFEKIHACNYFLALFEMAKYGIQFNATEEIIQLFISFEGRSRANRLACLINILDWASFTNDKRKISDKKYSFSLKGKQKFGRIEKITRYILNNLHRKLTVHEVSEIAYLTPQSFCRWFRKATGHSFVSFVNTSRIENACQLLLMDDANISQVALESGFESISQFNRVFKKLKGITASEFRRLEKYGKPI
ncbi:AraC family transcriptional regulator [Flagellimonas algicola]|uniref:AraC family transcriptional regulator n=1 Tax=Flagellimonas algicola TaxID=2583815 RepID=A0ABY2WGQ7_9FLAO|nr:AraC family transcriptional regulator [Allomuricauda algicola]TMU50735.1 AraC family transcriptional regulator [Allomuricauda algicola]